MRISDWSSDVCSSDLDDRAAGRQAAVRFRVAHDIERGAVLYRSAGVRIFALAPDFAAGFLARPLEQHQRRVADQLQAVFRNHHAPDLGRPPGRRKTASLDPAKVRLCRPTGHGRRSEEHTSELQSLMRISYAVFCLKKQIQYIL